VVKAVQVEDVRAEHSRLYVHGGEGNRAEAERKAWRRAVQAARISNLIGSERDMIWALMTSEEDRTAAARRN
jgi:hypothetical protein